MISDQILRVCRVAPGKQVELADYDTGWDQTEHLKKLGKHAVRERAEELLKENLAELADCQEKLYADNRYAVLVIFQALDAAGKDSTIKHVMSGLNPQGCQVFSFKQPSTEELDHTFLWRCMVRLPERGRIGIFNRSYYEEVLVVRVHPELLDRQRLPPGKRGKSFWHDRYDDINAFERHLTRNGTLVVKFYLNVSKREQKERFLERIERPEKNWKFSAGDVAEREYWDDYRRAYEEAISATSTDWAPWYIVPADNKWATRAIVSDILSNAIAVLDLRYPQLDKAQQAELAEARRRLENE
jgi:PPK2 family polyphosphate:nucleotide phosphotransferase